jgi:hypothetical protein
MNSAHAVRWATTAKFVVALVFVFSLVAGASALENHFRSSNAAKRSSGEASATYLKAKRPPRAYSGNNPQQAARLNQLRGMGTSIRGTGSK